MARPSPAARVSVVIAAHDAERYLRPAIASVLRQTVPDLELIVIDDGSHDATADILGSVSDPRLRVVRNSEQQGLAQSLNTGLDVATGRYVARLDADDVALPRRLELQLRAIAERAGTGIVGTSVLELDGDDRLGALHAMPQEPAHVRWHMLFSSPFYHPSVLVDRLLLDGHGLRYDTSYEESEDYELWSRLLEVTDGVNLPEPGVLYRVHPGQATQRRRVIQRTRQREIAMRQLAALGTSLGDRELDLAWRAGAGEGLSREERGEAAKALVAVLGAFEQRHGVSAEVRRACVRRLARLGALGAATRLDGGSLARAVLGRARRRGQLRGARRVASPWLGELTDAAAGPSPVRVTALFPEPTPYRAPLLDRIAARDEIALTVVHSAPTVVGRTWEVDVRPDEVRLRGLRIPGMRRLLRHEYSITAGVVSVLRRSAPDVLVIEGWSTFASQVAVLWSRMRRVPYVLLVSSHDHDPRAPWRRAVKRAVVPSVVGGAAGVLVSGTLVRRSMERRGARPERIHVFAYTIDVAAFGRRADDLAERRSELRAQLGLGDDDVGVLFVGRLVPEKDVATLVRAVAATGDPLVVLVVAGEGPERTGLERVAAELGVRVVFCGALPWEEMVEVYVAVDVLALLSVHEPWGVVVNEAAACGLPLVLSDRVGAARDLLRDGENGALIPAGDVAAAAAALGRLAADPGLRLAQGARSRELVAGWGYEPSVESFVRTVLEAAGR
ncbi:MAG: glycosyltransferase [Thermoleophilia bacterium]|nr:glycosyltransferase [Thermoleophilia bacterium]